MGARLTDVVERLQRDTLDVEAEVAFRRRVYAGRQSGARRSLRLVGVKNAETGRYHLYVTNVPAERLTAEQVARATIPCKLYEAMDSVRSLAGLEDREERGVVRDEENGLAVGAADEAGLAQGSAPAFTVCSTR